MSNIEWSMFPSGSEMQVGDQTVGLRAGLNYRFAFPGLGIQDASGNYLLQWGSAGASAVNYLQTLSATTTNAAQLTTLGSDSSVGMLLSTKGSGNITLTPGGAGIIVTSAQLLLNTNSPTTALQAASKGYVDSLIPSLPVSLANGGTSASLTASAGGIFYSTASAGAILSGTATANQVLLSGLSSAPSWSTAVYPATTTVSQLLYSSSANTISGLTTANNGVLVTGSTGVPSILVGPSSTGNMLMANTAAAPSWSTAMYANTYSANTILYASSANTVSGLATANNGVLVTSGAGVPSISSTLPSAVQGNITSLGTITSGVWNGTAISGQYGGTGVNNGASTITIGGNFAMSGAYTFTGTLTGNTSVTFPTSGTLATTSSLPTLPLSLANGGTGAALTASNGGIVYSGSSTLGILSGTSTANQIILSGSNTTPSWSTATYPSTTTINQLLYSSSANVIGGITVADNGVLITSNSGVPSWLANSGTPGYVLTANSGAPPSWQAAGSGSGFFDQVNTQTITATGSFTYTPTTGTKYAIFELQGGGGGSGGGGGGASTGCAPIGGGGGAYQKILVSGSTNLAAITGSVGVGGTAGASGNNAAGNGGNTTLVINSGTTWTAGGGVGGAGTAAGSAGNTTSGAAGGTNTSGTNGTLIVGITGGYSGWGFISAASAAPYIASFGGESTLSCSQNTATNIAVTGGLYGGGASGGLAIGANVAGAAGAQGIVIITEFISV